MKAVILAGGKGSRLEPFTHVFPKPLMPLGNQPILNIVLRQLAYAGIDEAVITVGHQASKFIKMVTAAGDFDLKIRYSEEKRPMGTAGPLKLIKGLGTDFIVMNGDILSDINFKKFIAFHKKNKALATIASFQRTMNIDFGVIKADGNKVVDYIEKPVHDYLVSMGIYAFKKEVLQYIPKNRRFDFPELVKKLLKAGESPAVYHHKGEWLDIGRPDDYKNAISLFFKKSKHFLRTSGKSFNRRSR
ncbi:MAG: NTP transferase domain-containing protein [candidate division Zixibacteria bacterium]|nr:NTP transferase domain-containing protein [candidate division Zixibacteria bacterium]